MDLSERKISFVLLLAIILSFSFGMATMEMDHNGNMTDCPLMNSTSICQMSFSEHIVNFKSMFQAVPAKTILLNMLILVFSLVVFFKNTTTIHSPPTRLRYFVKNGQELFTTNKILLALSDGILQPKLYA